MITIKYPFDEPQNYSYDDTQIEVTGGEAKLIDPGSGYPTDNPTIFVTPFIQATEVKSFTASEVTVGSDEVRYVVLINGSPFYWTGTEWATSTGYTETNTAVDINSNLSGLISEQSVIGFMAYLHSDDGTSTPSLLEVNIGIDNIVDIPELNDSIIWNYLLELDGSPIINEPIKVRSGWIVGDQVLTSDDFIQTITLANGYWQINLKIDDKEPDFLEWTFKRKTYKTNFLLGIHKFSELTILEQSDDFQ